MSDKFFSYAHPCPEDMPAYEELRKRVMDVVSFVLEFCPDGAKRDLALQKLEESIYWARNAGVRGRGHAA